MNKYVKIFSVVFAMTLFFGIAFANTITGYEEVNTQKVSFIGKDIYNAQTQKEFTSTLESYYTDITLQPGWNLVGGVLNSMSGYCGHYDGQNYIMQTSEFSVLTNPLYKSLYGGWIFAPDIKQYVTIFPMDVNCTIWEQTVGKTILNSGTKIFESLEMVNPPVWVYAKDSGTLRMHLYHRNYRYLLQGWNAISLDPSWVKEDPYVFKNLATTCQIEKIYFWDAKIQNWQNVDINGSLPSNYAGYGIFIKVKDGCVMFPESSKLTGDFSLPPAVPQ